MRNLVGITAITVSEGVMSELSNFAEMLKGQGIMMTEAANGSVLPRHDPSKGKYNDFGKIISKTRGACVITRFWTNPEVGRKRDGLRGPHVEDL
jgi:hypothetical protein